MQPHAQHHDAAVAFVAGSGPCPWCALVIEAAQVKLARELLAVQTALEPELRTQLAAARAQVRRLEGDRLELRDLVARAQQLRAEAPVAPQVPTPPPATSPPPADDQAARH